MRKLCAILLCVATLSAALSAATSVEGDSVVEPHRHAVIAAKDVPPSAAVLWDFDDEKLQGTECGNRLVLSGPAGTYNVKLRVIEFKDGKTTAQTFRHKVTFKSCHPVPPLPIPPGPTPTPPAPPKGKGTLAPAKAIGKLRLGNAGCTACVIGPRRADGKWDILTANHCIAAASGTLTLLDGRVLKVTQRVKEASSDICWMTTDEPHDDLPYANLSKEIPPNGTEVWHAGYGFDRPGNREEGTVTGRNANRQLAMILNVSSGDSGGPIFRADTDEVVSTVCCTQRIAAKVTMYGGDCVRAAELRANGRASSGGPPPLVDDTGTYYHPIEIAP
jgi:V8-like Glu-specific endopeptidase